MKRPVATATVVFSALLSAGCGAEVGSQSHPRLVETTCPSPAINRLTRKSYDDWAEVAIALKGYGRKLEAAFGDRYVEKWLEVRPRPSKLHIGVKGITQQDQQALENVVGKYRDRFVLVESKYGGGELKAYRKIIEERLRSYRSVWSAIIDGERDLVLIHIDEEPDGLREEILNAGVPSDAFAFAPGFGPTTPLTATPDDPPASHDTQPIPTPSPTTTC